jgi:hypothetical protein
MFGEVQLVVDLLQRHPAERLLLLLLLFWR